MEVDEKWRDMNEELAGTLNDPEASFQWVKRLTGLSIGLSVASVSLALTVIYVQSGSTGAVFASLALFWGGYLFAHYTATGKLVHQGGKATNLPDDRFKAVLAVIGVLLVLAGITYLPFPAVNGDISRMSMAGLTAAAGYVMAHYGFAGNLL